MTVTPPGSGTPTGTVTVSDGTDDCVITLPATSCNLTPTTVGAKTLVASYSGDANFGTSASPGVAHLVELASTTSVVSSVSPNVAVFGQAVTVTAEVNAESGTLAPDGQVTLGAGTSSCTATLAASTGTTSTASCDLAPPLAAASSPYTVTAAYAGSGDFAASVSSGAGNGSLTIGPASTAVAITGNTPNPSDIGAPITVEAVVSVVAPGAGTPTGTVVVTDGTDDCTITLPATTCEFTPTTAGENILTATYSGDADFEPSLSPGIPHTVLPVVTFTGPTVAPGVDGTITLIGGSPSCTLVDPAFVPVDPIAPPELVTFPFGLVEFSATGCGAGSTITIQLDYTGPLPDSARYFKFGPSSVGGQNDWYPIPSATIDEFSLTFSVTDGALGDNDLTANGTIVDPGGVGALGTVVGIPTLDLRGLGLLVLILAGMGWLQCRRLF